MKNNKLLINDIILTVLIICLCVLLFIFFIKSSDSQKASSITIFTDGVAVATLPLDSDCEYSVCDGFKIKISGGVVSVSQTNCPDKTCTKMNITTEGGEIICLPNRIVIKHDKVVDSDLYAG